MGKTGILYGNLQNAAHLCVDMQNIFAHGSEWATPWLRQILPRVEYLAQSRPDDIVFTRFIPPREPSDLPGSWQRLYEKWQSCLLRNLAPDAAEIVSELLPFAMRSPVFDKHFYCPWFDTALHGHLKSRGVQTLVVSGGETEVCVLSTVQGAIDLGYRVVIAKDALWSSHNSTHDAIIDLYHERFSLQVEAACVDEILDHWPALKI